MERIVEALGVDWRELHYVFPVRMVESEHIAVGSSMIDFPVIVAQLKADISALEDNSDSADHAKRSQCKHWLRRMTGFKFVAVALSLLDFDKKCKIFSKAQQSDAALALEHPTNHEYHKSSLGAIAAGALGSHVSRNLPSLKCGKRAGMSLLGLGEEVAAARECAPIGPDHFGVGAIVMKEKSGRGWKHLVKWKGCPDAGNPHVAASGLQKTPKELVAACERGDSPKDQAAASRASKGARRAEFKEPEEAAGDLARLGGAEEDAAALEVEARVRRYSMAMAAATLDKFDVRLPVPEVLLHLRTIFDFRRMPWGDEY